MCFPSPLLPQAQIDYLRKELSKKDTPKHERDTLAVIVTQVEQELQQHQQKQKEQQQQEKDHQQPHFVGKVYIC